MTAITDKNLRNKLTKEKTIELEKNDRINQTKHLWEKEQEKYNSGSNNIGKRKTSYKRRTNTKMGEIRYETKKRTTENRPCRYCGVQNWTPIHKCPATETNCNQCWKKGHDAVCRQKYINNRTVEKLTEEEIDTRNETSSESDETLYHIKKQIKNCREKQTIHGNSENKRDKERIYNPHRIADNNNATRREDSKVNRIRENH